MNEASLKVPFTVPVPFQSQIAAVQGDSLPVIWFLSPSTRSYKLIAVSDLPATQSKWWLDALLAPYLYSNDQSPQV